MTAPVSRSPTWATTSSPEPTPSLLMELDGLGDHFQHCASLGSPAQSLRQGAGLVQRTVAARAVTAVAIVAALGVLAWWLV